MKYHKQEHLYNPEIGMKGSCYPTVFACLLDLPLNEVPYFHLFYWTIEEKNNINRVFRARFLGNPNSSREEATENQLQNFDHWTSMAASLWDIVLKSWLASKGYEEEFFNDLDEYLSHSREFPYLVSGLSARGIEHVVIYKGHQMIHDPHPSNDGLVSFNKQHPYSFLKKI